MKNGEAEVYEKDIQRAICEWLERQGYFFWRMNNVPVFARSGRKNDGAFRFRSLPKYTPKGLPDIAVIFGGKFIALEIKRPKGRISPHQLEFASKTERNGGIYRVVHSVEEAEEAFRQVLTGML